MITIEDAYSYFYNERLFAEDWLMAENNKQEQFYYLYGISPKMVTRKHTPSMKLENS